MSEYIEINCYDKDDIEFKKSYSLSLKPEDLQKGLLKDENGCFVKYNYYHYRDGKMHSKTEETMRLDQTEYKRLRKLLK